MVVSQVLSVESWPKACWRGGWMVGYCKRLLNRSGREVACVAVFCALQIKPDIMTYFNDHRKEGGVIVAVLVSQGSLSEMVKQFSYWMRSSEEV